MITNLESRRHLSPWAWRTIIGGVLGLGYVSFHFFVRSVRAQKTWIKMRLLKPKHIPPSAGPYPPFDRPNEAAVLRNYLNHPPAGPCIFVGPDGSGKSHILEQAIENRKMVVYLDLQREPVINGEEILTQFINKISYILPPTKFIARIFLKDESKMVLSAEEINKAFHCFEQVLSDQKRMGWPDGIPVICINDFHFLGSSNDLNLRSKNIYEDKQILKFMDWCLFLTDNKLCHVVFVTSFSFCHLELDTHSAFRSRREVLKFGYASVSTVRHHFKKVNQLLTQHFKEPLTESEIKRLATFVGGQVKDLDTVITGLLRGYTPSQVIDYMISDSLQIVSDSLESCLRPVISADGEEQALEKDDAFEKYLRLWRMIELIAQNAIVSRSDLLRIVFQENVSELEAYESSGLVAYVHKKPISMSLSAEMDAEDTVSSLARLAPEFMVSAGTPRLNMAFQILRKDEKAGAQKRSLEIKLKKKKLEKEEKELNETKKQLLEERKELVNETQSLLRYHQEFQSLFGEEEFTQRKADLLSGTRNITEKLRNIVRDQEEVKEGLRQLREEVKQLKKRSEKDVVGEYPALSP